MKKKVIFIILIIVFIISYSTILTNMNTHDYKYEKYEGDNAINIFMNIKEGTLTPTSATIIIKDLSGKKNLFYNNYYICKKENNNWIPLEYITKNVTETLEPHFMNEDGILEIEAKWETVYGKLIPGKYKLVKYATSQEDGKEYAFSVDFTIN